MLTHLQVDGFRRLNGVDLALRPLNVLIGPNGSGKTSLLDAVWLLRPCWYGALRVWFEHHGGFAQTVSNLNVQSGRRMTLSYEVTDTNSESVAYLVSLQERGPSYSIESETLDLKRATGSRLEAVLKRNAQTAMVQTISTIHESKWESREAESDEEWGESALAWAPWARVVLGSTYKHSEIARFGVLEVGPQAPVRLPGQLGSVTVPRFDGSDLASCLYTLRESHPESFEAVEAALRSAFLEFERLGFPPVAAGMIVLTWKDRTSSQAYYVNQLSEGTLRFLWLVTILTSPGLPPVTIIDEPEVSLHPRMLMILAELMREASLRTQLFVATHSATLIGFLEPKEVLAINRDEETGNATFQWADDLDLEAWLRDYNLGELWQIGQIGGR